MKGPGNPDKTELLNVDLDVISEAPLDALAKAFGDGVFVLYVGQEGDFHGLHLELAKIPPDKDADELIIGLAELIERLPRGARKLWHDARSREFNIGIQAASKPHRFELRLEPKTLKTAAHLGARVAVTVYAPETSGNSESNRRRK